MNLIGFPAFRNIGLKLLPSIKYHLLDLYFGLDPSIR